MGEKAKRIALTLPATLACVSASPSPNPYYWSFGPGTGGRQAVMRIKALSERFEGAWWYWIATAPHASGCGQGKVKDSVKKGDYYLIEATISSYFWKTGKAVQVQFGLSKVPFSPGVDLSNVYLSVYETIVPEKDESQFAISKDEVWETGKRIYYYDPNIDKNRRFIDNDAYETLGTLTNAALPSRLFPLQSMHLDYYNPIDPPRQDPSGTLRIITNKDDFSAIGSDEGAFRSVPLSVTVAELGGGLHRYSFILRDTKTYSRIDYKALDKVRGEEPYFRSRDLYLPLREGHDAAFYRFQVVLENIGAYGDEVIWSHSVYSAKKLFGPCDQAQYCVIGE